MKALQRANINALISALLWGVLLSLVIRASRQFVPNDKVGDIIWYGGNYLAMILYPILVSLLLRWKIDLWINICIFSMIGGVYAVLIMYVINAFQLKAWTNFGLGVFGIWFIGQMLVSNVARNYAVQQEWDSPEWEKLNQASFWDFLILRFDPIDGSAG